MLLVGRLTLKKLNSSDPTRFLAMQPNLETLCHSRVIGLHETEGIYL